MDNKLLVLYAEDDIDDRELLQEGFWFFPQYELRTFPNGALLLQFLQTEAATNPVCLIVLDINMPVLTGVETLQALKADLQLAEIPVVLFSTSGSPADRKAAASVDTEIVLKPASYQAIQGTIAQLLQKCKEPVLHG